MDLRTLIRDPQTVFIDVRTPGEFDEQHIEGAKNIPLDEIMEHVEEIREIKKPIVLYCRSGARSGQALHYLMQNGIEKIYNGGGISNVIIHKL